MSRLPPLKRCPECGIEYITLLFSLVDRDNVFDTRRLAVCTFCMNPDQPKPVRGTVYWYMTREGIEHRLNNQKSASAKRRAHRLQAVPPWADHEKIKAIYEKAEYLSKMTKRAYEVDHIIPLVHPDVCGLHVENNLQAIPKSMNRKKGNRFKVV